MKKIIAILLMLTLTVAAFAACGKKDEGGENPGGGEPGAKYMNYPVLNAGFEETLGTEVDRGWDYALDNAFMPEDFSLDAAVKNEGEKSLKLAPPLGGYISIYQVLPIDGAAFAAKFTQQLQDQKTLGGTMQDARTPKNGDKVNLTMDVYLSGEKIEDFSGIKLMVEAENAKKNKSIIAQNEIKKLNMNAWNTISVSAVSNNGCIKDDSVLILISIKIDVPEKTAIYIDNIKVGTSSSGGGNSGEEPGQSYDSFDSRGMAIPVPNNSFEESDVKFKIDGIAAPVADTGYYGGKSIRVENGKEAVWSASLSGYDVEKKTLSAGAWVYIDGENQGGKAKLILRGKINNVFTDLASCETDKGNVWVYLKTPLLPKEVADSAITDIRIALRSESGVPVYFDYVQAGDWQRINGNPQKMAFMAYQPWFRNSGAGNWGNWAFDSSAGAANGGRRYNPANIVDGKRDVASVYDPTIGVYDSTDPEVLGYHVDLIKAMGCDVIQVNYYADLPSAAYQLTVLENLFRICEQKDMKVSILYEPKIHLSSGWIPHANRGEAVKAMGEDLVKFIRKYDNSKALLRYNNVPMIEVFGLNLVSGSEWGQIRDAVKAATGYLVPIMGDGVGDNDYSNIMSMFQWNLYRAEMKNYTAAQSQAYCKGLNSRVLEWSNADIGARIPVGIVYPGFDDTPVMSWAPDKGIIRKINSTGPDFYNASWAGFNELSGDFDWVLVATFNDWTEGTIIEPTTQLGHTLAYLTMKNIASFKGTQAGTEAALSAITESYLSTRLHNYNDLTYYFGK